MYESYLGYRGYTCLRSNQCVRCVVMWRGPRVHTLSVSFPEKNIPHMSHNISPPPVPVSPPSTGVRRHHTISAASRTARAGARATISEESQVQDQQLWNDDEPVDQDWVGGVGAVGEKTSLHRQSSLPTNSKRGPPDSFSSPCPLIHPISQLSAARLPGRLETSPHEL